MSYVLIANLSAKKLLLRRCERVQSAKTRHQYSRNLHEKSLLHTSIPAAYHAYFFDCTSLGNRCFKE